MKASKAQELADLKEMDKILKNLYQMCEVEKRQGWFYAEAILGLPKDTQKEEY
jgi:hypothetical protein